MDSQQWRLCGVQLDFLQGAGVDLDCWDTQLSLEEFQDGMWCRPVQGWQHQGTGGRLKSWLEYRERNVDENVDRNLVVLSLQNKKSEHTHLYIQKGTVLLVAKHSTVHSEVFHT